MNSYFRKGYKKRLTASDLYSVSQIDENDKSSVVTEKLSRLLNKYYVVISVKIILHCFKIIFVIQIPLNSDGPHELL